jgi:hypothetical protein
VEKTLGRISGKQFSYTVQYGGGSIAVCRYMEASGVENIQLNEEDIMNTHVYVNVLREYLKASAKKLGFKNILHFTTKINQNILHI